MAGVVEGELGKRVCQGTAGLMLCSFPASIVTTAIKSCLGFGKLLLLWRKNVNQHRCKFARRLFPCWSIFVFPAKACVATFGMQVL